MKIWRTDLLSALLIAVGLLLIALYLIGQQSKPTAVVQATASPEPILPTRTPIPTQTIPPTISPSTTPTTSPPTSSPTIAPSGTPEATVTPVPTLIPLPDRFGIGAAGGDKNVLPSIAAGLLFRHYLNWEIKTQPVGAPELVFWQMVRLKQTGVVQDWDEIAQVIAAWPGAIWIVGNEPDVIWQDNVTPERYAELYHEVYDFIKDHDPTAQLAVAGVAQPTPLRLRYLDQVLAAYEANYGVSMPVDVWTIHAFILREEAGSWGVDIPPGLDGADGRLYEIADHTDITLFKQSLIDFRAWMAERGYRERPLAVTEYGAIMPPDYGFPPEEVAVFMTQTLEFMATAVNETGYPPDGNRLVQWWFWYSLSDPSEVYAASNLYNPVTGQLTVLGEAYAAYARETME